MEYPNRMNILFSVFGLETFLLLSRNPRVTLTFGLMYFVNFHYTAFRCFIFCEKYVTCFCLKIGTGEKYGLRSSLPLALDLTVSRAFPPFCGRSRVKSESSMRRTSGSACPTFVRIL